MSETIVLYFSMTGTTKQRAKQVAKTLKADIAEIHPMKPYTTADLDWHNKNARATIEQKQEHDGRVPMKNDLPDISRYSNVIIGHPIWWGIPPRVIASVIDHLNLNGKSLATFGTSSSSNYARAQRNIERTVKENCYHLKLKQGAILNTTAALNRWITSLNFV